MVASAAWYRLLQLLVFLSSNLYSDCEEAVCNAGGLCSSPDDTLQPFRLSLEWFLNPDHLPLVIANRTGLFAESGLRVDIAEPDAEDYREPLERIKSGELDAAVVESIQLLQYRALGEQVLGFGRFQHTNGGVMYLEESGIKRPRDMCKLPGGQNRKVRIQYPGAPDWSGLAIIKTMVEADGGSCDVQSMLEPVNEGAAHVNALVSGKADVATLIFSNVEIIEAKHRGAKAKFFSLKHWGVPDFCQLVFFTTRQHFGRMQGAMRALNLAVRKAVDFIHEHPDEARQIYVEWTGLSATDTVKHAILNATLPMFPNDQTLAWEYWDNLEDWLLKTHQINSPQPVLQDYWTNAVAL